MDEPLVFVLPDDAFVAFDDEPVVASRHGARHALDADAFAAFFRRYGVDIADADAEDVRSLADLLSTLSWDDAEATTVEHPAGPDELRDLTRLFLAHAAAGADLQATPAGGTYLDDDGLRATARATADGCDACTAAVVDGVGATYYEICSPHRRALYRRAVESDDGDTPDVEAVDVSDCVDRLATDDDPTAAAAALARVARETPERVRPARSALFDLLDRLRSDPFADEGPARAAVTALAGLATVDAETRTRLVELLADDHAGVRRYAATAVGVAAEDPETAADLVADEDDGGLLDRVVGGSGPPPAVARLAAMLDEQSPENRARALFALTELARDHPGAVVPVGTAIRERLDDEAPDGRFRAAVAVGVLARHDSGAVGDAGGRLRELADGTGLDADAATVALAFRDAGGLDVGRSRDDLRRALRGLADPSRRPDRTVREAALALGAVGTAADLDYLEWVRACAGSPRVAEAAERGARELRERV